MKTLELKKYWRPTGNLRIDLPIMKSIVETRKLQRFIAENMPRRKAG